MSGGATERLSRLLAMVPYLVSRQGIPIGEAAREFGITQQQLVKDLELPVSYTHLTLPTTPYV